MLTDLGLALPVAVAFIIKHNSDVPSIEEFLNRINDAVNKLGEQQTSSAFGFYTVL